MGYKILTIASEWFSYNGGLSTFNRSLSEALAAAGHEVACFLPTASPEEIADAASKKITLVQADCGINLTLEAQLCLPLQATFQPQIIIGHGHITGPAAAAQVKYFHPDAKRIHFLHTLPEELEWFKDREGEDIAERAERRQHAEARLAMTAALAVAVGPRLMHHWNNYMQAKKGGVKIHLLTPGLLDLPVCNPPIHSSNCLLLGRLEDSKIKGVDIAAAAMGVIARTGRLRGPKEPILVLRGVTPGTSRTLLEKLREYSGTGISSNLKHYTHDMEQIREDIARASVVLMPSRAEGFGLVGLEALAMGVPCLVSMKSGLGELILDRIDADKSLECARKYVIDVRDDLDVDAERWADAISFVLENKSKAFEESGILRGALLRTDYWTKAAKELIEFLNIEPLEAAPTTTTTAPPDLLRIAKQFYDAAPAISVVMSTSMLEQKMESLIVSRGIAKAGLQPLQYLALIRNKGFLKPSDADNAKELLHRRNMAVHGAGSRIDQSLAEDHLRSVEDLVRILEKIE